MRSSTARCPPSPAWLSIAWRIDANGGSPRIVLTWTESGGPAVTAPDRAGQGTRFIKGSARYELRGDATLDFRPEGLRATIGFFARATRSASTMRPDLARELSNVVR